MTEVKTRVKSAEKTKEEREKLRDRLKRAAISGSAGLISHVPKFGLKFVVKRLRRKLEKHFDENPEGLEERELRYKRGFALKMIDVFLARYNNFAPSYRYKLIKNLGQNALLGATAKRELFKKEEGFAPPALTVMSPTMRCNLNCTGCYAYEYNKTMDGDMSYELMKKVTDEAKDMGQAFFVITGGEPMIRKDDVFRLVRENDDMYFIMYTNGQLFTDEIIDEMVELGNITPCISVEGYETETDKRRGEGVHARIIKTMEKMRDKGVPFAISVTVTRENADLVTSDDFFDYYVDKGAIFAWYFQLMPIGREPSTELMTTPEQRNAIRRRIREVRESDKLILPADFWGDAFLSNGCLAAKTYLHVSGTGWIEPCVFAHFAVHHIKDTTIREALKSKFFTAYREKQNTITDRYQPCGIVDFPKHLRESVQEARAAGENVKGTHPGAESVITDLAGDIDKLAEERQKVVGKAWRDGEL